MDNSKISKSLFEAFRAFGNVIQTLFKKMPILFLLVIYLIDLGTRAYLSAGWSIIYLVGLIILIVSIGIYTNTKSIAETTLSFVLGILTIYAIDWETANFTLFILLYLAFIVIVFFTSSIRLATRQESILIQAASKLDMVDYKNVYKRIKEISQKPTKYGQLSIIEKSEVIRYLAFRQVIIGEYEEAIRLVELIKTVCQIDLVPCCEIYYGFYMYCYNKRPTPPNISREVEKMFDKITTLTVSYVDFFTIFSNTRRILVEERLTYEKYVLNIKLYALKGYGSEDIIELLKDEYLH